MEILVDAATPGIPDLLPSWRRVSAPFPAWLRVPRFALLREGQLRHFRRTW